MSYQKDRLINVTTQLSADGHGWQVEVMVPPHVGSRDKRKMIVWLNRYQETIKEKVPNVHVTVYHNDPKFVLVATPQSADERLSTADRAKARMNHMFSILGRYGKQQASVSP